MEQKQVLVMRKDLKVRRGKEIAQGAHASWAGPLSESKRIVIDGVEHICIPLSEKNAPWFNERFKKVTCYVNSEEELLAVYEAAKAAGLTAAKIVDAGLTEFHGVKTLTCISVGPDFPDKVDAVTGHLPLY